MSAPGVTVRQTPAGIKLDDGYRTLICPSANPDVSFWEKTIKPPGIDGMDAIDTTTMHNLVWRTKSHRALKTLTDATLKAAYDPNLYNDILSLVNVSTAWTVRFPDGSTLAFWGFLKGFEADELKEGDQPEISITIVPTNQDPTTGSEEAPVLTSAPGT